MDDTTKGIIITDSDQKEFRSVGVSSSNETSSSVKSISEQAGNAYTETTKGILEALKDYPEKLFAFIALIGFILVAFSGNMKDWKNLFIFILFLVIDILFLLTTEWLKNK